MGADVFCRNLLLYPYKGWCCLKKFIVVAEQLMLDCLCTLFDQQGLAVFATGQDGTEAIQLCKLHQPDVILLQLRISELSGVLVSEQIRIVSPQTEILLLAQQRDVAQMAQAIKVGVQGIVTFNCEFSKLQHVVHQMLQGARDMPKHISSLLLQDLVCPKLQKNIASLNLLNLKQKLILQLTAQGYTAKEIANKLFLSKKTVEFHRGTITKKLSFTTLSDWVRFAIRNGLIDA